METTILLTKIIGPYLAIVGLACLIHPKRVEKLIKDLLKNDSFIFMSGAISLLIGMILVSIHNIWVWNWQVIITLVAWIAVFKGVCRMFFPSLTKKALKSASKNIAALAWISFLLGLYLCYLSYWF